jgi:hypothetical protein
LLKNNGIDYEVLKDRIVLGKPGDIKAVEGASDCKDNASNATQLANSIPVTGKVVDEKGLPLPGATVLEKGTQNATQTDINGNFKLNVTDENSVLVIAFVSYRKTEVTVGKQEFYYGYAFRRCKGLKRSCGSWLWHAKEERNNRRNIGRYSQRI